MNADFPDQTKTKRRYFFWPDRYFLRKSASRVLYL